MKFRKKPVEIDAIQWNGVNDDRISLFCPDVIFYQGEYFIDTLEGWMRLPEGCWIIKGIKGEFYSCKPDIFEATYEPVI